jgi:hypothetical protein
MIKLFALFPLVILLQVMADQNDLDEDRLNIVFYRFPDLSEDLIMEIVPGDRFRLPLIRGYQVRLGYDSVEIVALTDQQNFDPEGTVLQSGHFSKSYNLGRISSLEYELLVSFDHQTDIYYFTLRDDSLQVYSFRDEFTNVVTP